MPAQGSLCSLAECPPPSRDFPSAPTMRMSRRQGLLTCAVKGSSHLSRGSKCRMWGPHAKWQQQRLESLSPWSPCPMPTATAQMSFLPPGGAGTELLGSGGRHHPGTIAQPLWLTKKKNFCLVVYFPPTPAQELHVLSY